MAIQFKRSTEASRAGSTVILEQGQPLFTTDKNILYIGDGTTKAKDLQGTAIGLNLKNGEGENSIVSIPDSDNVNVSHGLCSIVLGNGCENYAKNTFVCGRNNIAGMVEGLGTNVGRDSFVSGNTNKELGGYSIIGGSNNTNNGQNNIITGSGNTTQTGKFNAIFGQSNTSSGSCGFITGDHNVTANWYSSSLGYYNQATGQSSTTIGEYNIAAGTASLAIGNHTSAHGLNSFCSGTYTIARGSNQFVCGRYNVESDSDLLIVGSGYIGATHASDEDFESLSIEQAVDKGIFYIPQGGNDGVNHEGKPLTSLIQPILDISGAWEIAKSAKQVYVAAQIRKSAFRVLPGGYCVSEMSTADAIKEYNHPKLLTTRDYVDTKIEALDVTAITGSTSQTITSISESDGKISATYSNIAFPVTSVAGKTGAVTLTKSDVGLSNVDNTSDATKKANFTGSIASGNTGFVTGGDVYTELNKKADKATTLAGYGITNAYTKTEIDSKDSSVLGTSKTYTDEAIQTLANNSGYTVTISGSGFSLANDGTINITVGFTAESEKDIQTHTLNGSDLVQSPLTFSNVAYMSIVQTKSGFVSVTGARMYSRSLDNTVLYFNTVAGLNEDRSTYQYIVPLADLQIVCETKNA